MVGGGCLLKRHFPDQTRISVDRNSSANPIQSAASGPKEQQYFIFIAPICDKQSREHPVLECGEPSCLPFATS